MQRAVGRGSFAQQTPEGFWCGELTADTTLESDYILLQLWLHQPEGAVWNPPSRGRIERAARSILERQLPDGGFNIYAGGPADVSATVKAYCALKLAGIPPDSEPLRRARDAHPGAGRSAGGQQLRQDQPQPVRAVSAAARALGAAGDRDAAGQRALRDVVVDALHPGAAFHRAGARFEPARARRVHPGRAAAARREPGAAQAQRALGALPSPGPRLQGLGEARLASAFAAPPSARPSTGFWTARASPKAWAPSTRR